MNRHYFERQASMITQETAARIWQCYREIEAAQSLLDKLSKAIEDHEEFPKDHFGRKRDFQLGIPFSDNSSHLFGVKPQLAESIIRAHIANKQAELAEANEQARVEIDQE